MDAVFSPSFSVNLGNGGWETSQYHPVLHQQPKSLKMPILLGFWVVLRFVYYSVLLSLFLCLDQSCVCFTLVQSFPSDSSL